MALIDSKGNLVANVSQPFQIFLTRAEYSDWVSTLDNPEMEYGFAVIKGWENPPALVVGDKTFRFQPESSLAEEFKFTINTGADRRFIIPTNAIASTAKAASWKIEWGDGSSETRTATPARDSNGIAHTYDSVGNYTISITPGGPVADGWFLPFGFNSGSLGACIQSNKDKLTQLDSSIPIRGMKLPANTQNFLAELFWGCSKLAVLGIEFTMPDAAKAQANTCFGTFYGCSSLKELPLAFTLPALPNSTNNAFVSMFQDCSSLEGLPPNFTLPTPSKDTRTGWYTDMFNGCVKLKSLNAKFNIPATRKEFLSGLCVRMFKGCADLVTLSPIFRIPAIDKDMKPTGDIFTEMFDGCISLEANIQTLFAAYTPGNTPDVASSYFRMFAECGKVSGYGNQVITLFGARANIGDRFTFRNCTSLTDFLNIPYRWSQYPA